ncbi:MAG: SHOCT domain-containing protein [Rhodovibrio sp.]|nr:SHOCT domain-containing protein [Rhodovibrio sp.]
MRRRAKRLLARGAGGATLVLAAAPALAQQGQGMYGRGMYGGHGMGTWWGPFMGILMLAAGVAVIVAGILVLRHFWHIGARDGPDASGGQARAILDERYARGEIDREEYLRRRRDLEGKGG